jgi:GNAT superfamily N-acetyltransferase
MNGDLVLRTIAPEDEPFLLRLYSSTRVEELAQVPWQPGQQEAFLRMQYTAQRAHYREHYPDPDFSVILRDGEPVGRLYVHRQREEIRIVDISLLPEHRGQGVGTRLLRVLIEESRQTGKPVRIHVERMSPALGLYQRLGFRLLEDRGVHWFMEWSPSFEGLREAQ